MQSGGTVPCLLKYLVIDLITQDDVNNQLHVC